jgi:tetratricopeptide (TPR) repeat protein
MTAELAPTLTERLRLPSVPWRDPHTVSPTRLKEYIQVLEAACERNPRSADLRTCLGMAYAMNYQVYKSEDALELAIQLDPTNFYAQLKYAELHYRLRALVRAEDETLRATDLATNTWELNIARKQLQEIRKLRREGSQKPEWTKPLTVPAFCLLAMTIMLCLAVYWK